MSKQPSLSVILPTIDEAENLRGLIPALLAELPAISELVVVDDGSTDGTQDVVRGFAAADRRVRLIERKAPPCLTEAIQEGLDASSGELVGWMDADWSILPADLGRLYEVAREDADLAVASRFAQRGWIKGQSEDGLVGRLKALTNLDNEEDSWVGVALSWALNGLILPLMLSDGIHDYTSGVVVARRAVFDRIRLQGDHGEYFIDLWVRATRAGYQIAEIPYHVRPRAHGYSKTANSLDDWLRRGRRYLRAAWYARRHR